MDMKVESAMKKKRIGIEQNISTAERVEKDYISKLPDDILLDIMSSLPTESAIRTGVLSKRWEGLWKKLKHMIFDDQYHQDNFTEHVTTAMKTYELPNFKSLTIRVKEHCDYLEMGSWMTFGNFHGATKFVFRLNKVAEEVSLVGMMLQHDNKLQIFKLMGNIKICIADYNTVSLNCLKALHLYCVKFWNEDSLRDLQHGCPVLEVFVIDIYIKSGVRNLTINIPTLQELTLGCTDCEEENIVIHTPRLKSLNIHRFDGVNSCRIDATPELVEAKINQHNDNIAENILGALTTANHLFLSAPLNLPMTKMYAGLISLDLDTKAEGWCRLLVFMLTKSPNLKFLKIIGGRYTRSTPSWSEPQHLPSCLSTNLLTLEWKEFVWDGANDIAAATYILKNGSLLRKATLHCLKAKTVEQVQQRHDTINRITHVPRTSASCILEFRNSTPGVIVPVYEQDPDVAGFSY